jgi:hypothetical protein
MNEFFGQLAIGLLVLDAFARCFFLWRAGRRLGSSSSSSSSATQFGNQTNQGAPNNQGNKNKINTGTITTTTAKTSTSTKTDVNASTNIKAAKGSTVNYITGGDSSSATDILKSLGNVFQSPASTPVVVTPGSVSTGSAASTGLNWNLVAIAGAVLAAIFFFRKKS